MPASGMLAVDALIVAARTTNNTDIETMLIAVTKGVVSGKSIAEQLKLTGIFTPMAIGLIAVCERANRLDEMLDFIADFHDNDIAMKI